MRTRHLLLAASLLLMPPLALAQTPADAQAGAAMAAPLPPPPPPAMMPPVMLAPNPDNQVNDEQLSRRMRAPLVTLGGTGKDAYKGDVGKTYKGVAQPF